jgi:type VI secretion system protein ImpM
LLAAPNMACAADNDAPAGWHGKLPTLGDFASRRLPEAFVEAWDRWLAEGLLKLRTEGTGVWLEAYLASPSWRFLAMPGALGRDGDLAQAWAGVVMPSVDRVGRYFPLTLAKAFGAGPGSTQQMELLWHWLARLDDLARDAIFDDWTVDRLESELAHLGGPPWGPLPQAALVLPTGAGQWVEQDDGRDAARCIAVQAERAWADGAAGLVWWHARPDEGRPRMLISRGWPQVSMLSTLFAGAGAVERGREAPAGQATMTHGLG